MSLLQQVLRLCTVSLAVGIGLWAIRGLPKPVEASGATHMCAATPSDENYTTVWIEQSEARALLGDPGVVFVDCRPTDQFMSGHIAGALSMPSEQELFGTAAAMLRSARTIIAYCDAQGGCESSQRLAARLRELGLPDVRILRDGLPGWLERSFPAESGPCRLCLESRP